MPSNITESPPISPPIVNNVYTQRPAFLSATQVLRRTTLVKIHRQLLEVIEEIFVKPQGTYVQQDSDNKRALHVRKVLREQAMKTTAEKVSKAIQAEGNVDPKIVKILVKDAVDAKFQETAAEKKQQASISKKKQTESKSKNAGSKNSGGAQQSGGASSSKKKSPTRASGNSGGESGNAANAGKNGRQPPSRGKSKKNGTKSTTKNNKTGSRSKKK